MDTSSIIRADWGPDLAPRAASYYSDRAFFTLEFLSRECATHNSWIDGATEQPILTVSDLSKTLAAGASRTHTTGEIIHELGLTESYLSDDVRATFSVGGSGEFAPGMVLVDLLPPRPTAHLAEAIILFLAATWNPDSVTWTDSDILLLSDDLGYESPPDPGALVWINESAQDPFVGGKAMLNGTLHRLADYPHDITAAVLHAAHRHPVQ